MGTYSADASASTLGARELGAARGRVAASRLPWALLLAGVGVLLWLIVDPRTPDLAAQVYRVALFRDAGFAIWDARWYAGHDLPGYSLTFPALAALLGMRSVGALAVLASTALCERLLVGRYGPCARWGAAWFALAALGDVWSGRLTFSLGVALALAAVLAFARAHPLPAAALAALCAASSPVAGLLLALAAATIALVALTDDRRGVLERRSAGLAAALALGAPALLVVAALTLLFGEGGTEPFPATSLLATTAVALAFLCALPRAARELRVGALVYLAAVAACALVPSAMGSNVARYGVLLAGPLLVCANVGDTARAGGRAREALVLAALLGVAVWTAWGPVRETLAVAQGTAAASSSSSYYEPVERFVAAHGGSAVRVEVPFTRGHWEAAWLAPTVSLARGWEKQLDERYDGVLLSASLTPAGYARWLHEQAVRYVALPDAPLDPSSAREGRLVAAGLPYLREIFASAHWRVYEVRAATPIVSGPGRLTSIGHDTFALQADAPGGLLVRVRYSRYLSVARGRACVARARGGWTLVTARAAGRVEVAARFSLAAVFADDSGSCRA